jgi:glycosyltransferase involved in cell wall biosynthesis
MPKAQRVDVMLLLEGTFPYVAGGVSSWVNQIMRGFPELRFGIVFLGSRSSDYGAMKFTLPDNLVHLECHYMHDPHALPLVKRDRGDAQGFELNAQLHHSLRAAREGPAAAEKASEANALLKKMLPLMAPKGPLSEDAFLFSERSWDTIAQSYRDYCTDPSFVDYFWTVRIMHAPIWRLKAIADHLIPAGCFHAISTGYAGFLGALLKYRTGRPLVLSEHGIYTKERKIDLYQSQWIRDNRSAFEKDPAQLGYFRELWVRFFEALGRMCYEACDQIVALYETNRLRQIADGADAKRAINVPNGINLQRLAPLRDKRAPDGPPLVLCLIGRVVPIKDVKTFIRSMRTVVQHLPEAQAWIAGPEDEDPAYAAECHAICDSLGLSEKVKFLGFQKIDDLLPKVGLLILSSISEALPLVILEGYAAGIPTVATDVGSCRQLIYGLGEEDQALGASGEVVRLADPEALATAAVGLLSDKDRWHRAQAAGIARVERYYTQELMFGAYRRIYDTALNTATVS